MTDETKQGVKAITLSFPDHPEIEPVRHELDEVPQSYTVGGKTMELVFTPNSLTNLNDLQKVLDAVEVALLNEQTTRKFPNDFHRQVFYGVRQYPTIMFHAFMMGFGVAMIVSSVIIWLFR